MGRPQDQGVTPSGSGLRPFGAEPATQSQAKPLVPNAGRWRASRFYRLLEDLAAATAEPNDLHERAAVCIDALAETVEDLLYQFAHHTTHNKSAALWTGGLSALEGAFDILGWGDPHRTPELTCDEPGCWEHATCGFPTPNGYRRTCFVHWQAAQGGVTRMGGDGEAGSGPEGTSTRSSEGGCAQ